MPAAALALLLLLQSQLVDGCSFLVANYNLTQRHGAQALAHANEIQQRRGPDATNIWGTVEGGQQWSFLHNLLSMTGAFTLQPFVGQDPSSGSSVVALFNGEVYNWRELSLELTGREETFSSGAPASPEQRTWSWPSPTHVTRCPAQMALSCCRRTGAGVSISSSGFTASLQSCSSITRSSMRCS